VAKLPETAPRQPAHTPPSTPKVKPEQKKSTQEAKANLADSQKKPELVAASESAGGHVQTEAANNSQIDDDDDAPLSEVPPLPRTGEHRILPSEVVNDTSELSNGKKGERESASEE
jgi:hypothetical protein